MLSLLAAPFSMVLAQSLHGFFVAVSTYSQGSFRAAIPALIPCAKKTPLLRPPKSDTKFHGEIPAPICRRFFVSGGVEP